MSQLIDKRRVDYQKRMLREYSPKWWEVIASENPNHKKNLLQLYSRVCEPNWDNWPKQVANRFKESYRVHFDAIDLTEESKENKKLMDKMFGESKNMHHDWYHINYLDVNFRKAASKDGVNTKIMSGLQRAKAVKALTEKNVICKLGRKATFGLTKTRDAIKFFDDYPFFHYFAVPMLKCELPMGVRYQYIPTYKHIMMLVRHFAGFRLQYVLFADNLFIFRCIILKSHGIHFCLAFSNFEFHWNSFPFFSTVSTNLFLQFVMNTYII